MDCTIFHYCQTLQHPNGLNESIKWDFACPQNTIFNQVKNYYYYFPNNSLLFYVYKKMFFFFREFCLAHLQVLNLTVKNQKIIFMLIVT